MMIINSSLPLFMECAMSEPTSIIFFIYNMTNIILLLPLCVLVLYLGLQRWWQRRSSTAAPAMSHFDSFNYHIVGMELVGVFGSIICCCGIYSKEVNVLLVGNFLLSFTWLGEMLFHVLTCLERYLAVVHPITYLSLRTARGIRIRNITNVCGWLLCTVVVCLYMFSSNLLDFFILVFFCIFISFCSLSVLCALIRPGPGEQDRDRVDQSKQRAFYTIMVILGVLFVRVVGDLMWMVIFMLNKSSDCFILVSLSWFNVPSSLVLPAVFLHRSGKLVCCRNNI